MKSTQPGENAARQRLLLAQASTQKAKRAAAGRRYPRPTCQAERSWAERSWAFSGRVAQPPGDPASAQGELPGNGRRLSKKGSVRLAAYHPAPQGVRQHPKFKASGTSTKSLIH